jgi:hypothetical protein
MKLYRVDARSTECPVYANAIHATGFGTRAAAERFLVGLAQSGKTVGGDISSYEDEDEDDDIAGLPPREP